MYTLAELEGLDIDGLLLPARIEASASVRVYLAEYASHRLDAPDWLLILARTISVFLRDTRQEHSVADAQIAKERIRGRLPFGERQAAIRAEIAALEAELGRI